MRTLISLVFCSGALLILVAVMLAVDALISDDQRADVQDTIDELAVDHAELSYPKRRRDIVGGIASRYVDLRDGMLFRVPISLADILPNAPGGWATALYSSADGQQITGDPSAVGSFVGSSIETTLFRFEREA